MKKDTTIIVLMTSLLLAPFALQVVHAQSTTATIDIQATCGLTVDAPISFGPTVRDAESSEDELVLTNTGSVDSTIEVSASDWKSGATVHIDGELTKFSGTESSSYASKTALNSTNTPISFGTVSPGTNSTFWQVFTTLQNLPFSGELTQTITFTTQCAV